MAGNKQLIWAWSQGQFLKIRNNVEAIGWVGRSDTHHLHGEGDGFREGLNPPYGLRAADYSKRIGHFLCDITLTAPIRNAA